MADTYRGLDKEGLALIVYNIYYRMCNMYESLSLVW